MDDDDDKDDGIIHGDVGDDHVSKDHKGVDDPEEVDDVTVRDDKVDKEYPTNLKLVTEPTSHVDPTFSQPRLVLPNRGDPKEK